MYDPLSPLSDSAVYSDPPLMMMQLRLYLSQMTPMLPLSSLIWGTLSSQSMRATSMKGLYIMQCIKDYLRCSLYSYNVTSRVLQMRCTSMLVLTVHWMVLIFKILTCMHSTLIYRTFNHIGLAAYQLFILLTTENYPVSVIWCCDQSLLHN